MNWTLELVAMLPNLLWFTGSAVVGNKRRYGWVLLFGSEGGWILLAVLAHLWSIIPWAILGLWLYWRNWRKWASHHPAAEHPH